MKRFSEWLAGKWQHPKDAEQVKRDYEQAIYRTFNTVPGHLVLSRWLDSIYCTISYVPNGKCCDTAFNEGQRALIHSILEAMDRQEHPKEPIEVEAD